MDSFEICMSSELIEIFKFVYHSSMDMIERNSERQKYFWSVRKTCNTYYVTYLITQGYSIETSKYNWNLNFSFHSSSSLYIFPIYPHFLTFWRKLREKTWCEINNVFQFNTNFPFQLHDDAIKVFLKMFKFMYLKLRLIHNLA